MEGVQAESSRGWAAVQEECSPGAAADREEMNDAVESMQDLVEEVEPVNEAVEGRQEDCFARVAADLTKANGMARQLEALFAAQEQEGGGGDAAAGGGYQRARALTSTICTSIDRALHIITSETNRAGASPAPGQPGSMLSSGGGDGSSRSGVSDQSGGNAPGQSKYRKTLPKPNWSTQVRVSNVQDVSPLDDGFSWRKYGEKGILSAKFPRAYFRCTHRHTQGCTATKQVQRTDGDLLLFDVVYNGLHTCSQGTTAAVHLNNQSMLPAAARLEHSQAQLLPAAEQTTTSGSEAGSVLTSEVSGSLVSRKRDSGGETRLSKTMAEKPPSTPYKDVIVSFAIGNLRQKGRLSHTCMQQVGQELLGRDDIRQKLMEKILLDSNGVNSCTVICVYGLSGLGKTSLLHVLYNDQQLLDAFDKRIWIQISEKVDMVMFFRKILEFAMNESCSIKNIDILRELVVEEIRGKKFLLFLDDADIENQQFWTTVLEVLNTGAKGSVVVMATKSSTVAAVTVRNVATHSYSLNPLFEENNLMLLQQYAVLGIDIQSNPDSMMIAKGIISRFGDNLLHLKAISGLLCHADTSSLEKDIFEESVMPLQLCYNALPVHLKRCLALCSLFPEGYIFDKHHMVLLWISHGCVRPVEGYELEDIGVEYFNELSCRSFFQCSPIHSDKDDMFVMHELIYNVVASVSHDKYFKSKDLLSSIPENVLHYSLISSQFQPVELMHGTEQLKDLQTFLALQPEWKPNNISLPTLNLVGLDDFFLKFTSLEILDLSHTKTEELPGSIAGLRNLRYLSVNSTDIRAFPSDLCSLSNLQTLEAKHCRFLAELPRDISRLVKLRHLDLTKELGYVHLPCGIGELSELQTLPVFHVSGDSTSCSISELGSLHNLRECLWLSGLESVKPGSKAQEANLKDKHRLKDLTLQWHDDDDQDEDTEDVADEQVLESLQPHANLQVLGIRGYKGTRFPAWMQGSSSLPNLVTLTLDSCCNCTEFPVIAHLPSLKFLSVRKMYDVQRLSSNTDGNGTIKFPSLELLNLWEMYGLEEVFSKESEGDCPRQESEGDCPRLRKVCISRCPNLKRMPRAPLTELVLHCGHHLPDISELASLVSLKIEGFHRVRSFGLPAAAAALRRLEIRSCKELSSVDGLSAALTTVRRIKITGCPKLVLPGTSSNLQTT